MFETENAIGAPIQANHRQSVDLDVNTFSRTHLLELATRIGQAYPKNCIIWQLNRTGEFESRTIGDKIKQMICCSKRVKNALAFNEHRPEYIVAVENASKYILQVHAVERTERNFGNEPEVGFLAIECMVQ